MIGFKTYLYESTNIRGTLEGLKKFFPLLSDKMQLNAHQHLNILIRASEDKIIYNARYSEASKGILNVINRIYGQLNKTVIDYRNDNKEDSMKLPWSLYTTSDIKKAIKDTSTIKNLPSQIKNFFDVIKDLPDAFNILKSYVKKGKEPKPVDPNKPAAYVKPPVSFNSTKEAVNFMKEAVSSFEKELHDNVSKQVQTIFEKIKNITSPLDMPKDMNIRAVASAVFITRPKDGKNVLELKVDSEERIKKLIDENVRNIIDGFVSKNATKLALILQKKGMPKNHTIIRTNVKNGMVENSMKFEFEDNSSFTLQSSVIYKYSNMGKLFFQYPTRFMNVKLADGSLMKIPSEKKMIEEF
jgi:hypothetical protein